jgi:hypothetical protein
MYIVHPRIRIVTFFTDKNKKRLQRIHVGLKNITKDMGVQFFLIDGMFSLITLEQYTPKVKNEYDVLHEVIEKKNTHVKNIFL